MANKMIKNILKNIENNIVTKDDIEHIWNLNKVIENTELIDSINKDNNNINFETNIYYPLIYQIEDNCPTCGYRTPISRQKYTEKFITKNIEYKLNDLDQYPITGINCYNKDITGLRELFIILNYLEKYKIDINVAISNYENLKYLKKYNLNSIIIIPQDFQHIKLNKSTLEKNNKYEEKVIKYIKENMCLNVVYQLTLNYNETHTDIFNIIMKMRNLEIDSIELKGFDPFIDSPEEYNPQYSKEYITKVILLLKLYLPNVKIKIQYATNNMNFFDEYKKLGINTITGVYTPQMNNKLENINKIKKTLKK